MTSGGDELFVTVGGKDVGLADILRKVDAEMQKSADQAVRLGQSYARLAQAQGRPAASSQILAGTIGQAGAASEKALIGIETQAARVGAGATYFEQFGSAAVSNLTSIVGPAAAATVAITALKGAFDLSQSSAKIDATRVSFDNLAVSVNTTGDALLTRMRAAADGTVSDANLIQSANSGLLLTQGRLASDLPRILEISRAAAQATGDDVNFVFNSLVTGIARGSPKIIDNAKITLDASAAMQTYAASIGKSVDQLNAAEQQQATLNAVLQAGDQLIKNAGAATDSNAQTFARLGVNVENAKNSLGSFLAAGLAPVAANLNKTSDATSQLISGLNQMAGTVGALATGTYQFAGAQQQLVGSVSAGTFAVNDSTAAQLAQANAMAEEGVQARAAAEAAQQKANADQLATVGAQTHTVAQNALAQQAQIAAQALLAAGGSGASAAAALAGSSNQVDVLTAAYYRLAAAQAAAGHAATLAKLQTQTPRQLIGADSEEAGIRSQNRATLNDDRSARIKAASDAADAERRYQQTLGNTAPALSHARDELAQLTKGSAAYINKQNEIAQLQKQADAAAKKAGGGGGGTKLSDQQRLQNSLLTAQEDYQSKSEDAAAQYATDTQRIYQDFYAKMQTAQRDFDQSQLEGHAGFYDQQGSIESEGIRKASSIAYEAASVEAGKIAQEKGADVAEKYMQAQEQIISSRAKRLSDIEKAEKDKNKGKAEYLRGVDAEYKKAEDAKLARIQEGEGSLVAERQKQLDDAAAKEDAAQEKIGTSADRAAERKIAASERAGKKIDEEQLKVAGLTDTYDRLGAAGSRAGITPAAAAPAATTPPGAPAPISAAAPTSADAVVAALNAAQGAIVAALASVERATSASGDKVAGALRVRIAG